MRKRLMKLRLEGLRKVLKAASAYLPSSVLTVGCDLKHKVTLDGGSSYTRTLHFLSDSLAVRKSITPWPLYAERWGVEFCDIALAYSATSTASGLIHVSPNGGEPTLNGGKYLVQLGPLGLQRADIRVASESQLRNAAHGILHGLNALHQAELVHRDLRWPNLACDMESASRFYLLDLEMCARADCKPAMAHPPAHWGPHALVGSLYTAASDLHCMGVMLRQYVNLATSDNARNFLGIVSAHAKDLRESAVELLQHPWISCAGAACTAADMPSTKDPYKCSAYRLQYISALPPAEARELVLRAAAQVQSTKAVAEAPGYVVINMPSRSCRAHCRDIAANLTAQSSDTVSLVQPERNSMIIGQDKIRRLFGPAPATAAPMVSLLPLSRAPGVAEGAMVPVAAGRVPSISLDPDVFHAFNNQRLHQFMENNQRLQEQWAGYIIRIDYRPLQFLVRLPDNQVHEALYFKASADGNTEFITNNHGRGREGLMQEGWHIADADDHNNPIWREFPHADKQKICARIREAALLCTVVGAAAVVMSTREVLAPSFYLFAQLRKGCKPTRDGIVSFIDSMKKMSWQFYVKRFHSSLPFARTGYRSSLPKDSMGDLHNSRWTLVTGCGGVRTPWPAASDFEVPEAIAAGGFGVDNAAMLCCIREAATRHVAHAIKHCSEQQVSEIVVTLGPGTSQQALAVLQRLYTAHGAEVLEKVLGKYAHDAAKEDADRLRAEVAAAKQEVEELQLEHSRHISDLATLRARHQQENNMLSAELQPQQQELTMLRATCSDLSEERYNLWAELKTQCKARGIFIGQYTSETDANSQQAQHNDNHRGQLRKLLKQKQYLREQHDDALYTCNILRNSL
ncbi:hypothetical protein JKP88DRAFT_260958 [Tribonema minus]|uniref:Protein kinase domain-containing protein n=1 Tax=Tribonema minus TaxID=303371 RepID=A0A835Z4Z3_9STRA|nr:hypothetical protein JKP88DRAFT_260958 [Tribonema minus]